MGRNAKWLVMTARFAATIELCQRTTRWVAYDVVRQKLSGYKMKVELTEELALGRGRILS